MTRPFHEASVVTPRAALEPRGPVESRDAHAEKKDGPTDHAPAKPDAQACSAATTVYGADVPDGWQQGRGAFGGLVLGTLARAMEQEETDRARRLRSLSGEICAPVLPGEADVEVATLRRGKGVTYLEARLLQKGAIVSRASAAFGVARATSLPVTGREPPSTVPWRDVLVVPVAPPLGPVFAAHYEYRSTGPRRSFR